MIISNIDRIRWWIN